MAFPHPVFFAPFSSSGSGRFRGSAQPRSSFAVRTRRRRAFTLVELLVVMGIIVVLIGITAPVMTSLKGGGDFNMATGSIAGTLEQARSYAMANNTYVYVGIGEFNAAEPASTSPRTAGQGKGGQVAVVAAASRDGTRGYDVNDPKNTWEQKYSKGALLTSLDKLRLYDNLHLVDFGDNPPASGKMKRAATPADFRVGNAASASMTRIAWPLGKTLDAGQYNFTNVIQFDPQGVARIQLAANSDDIASSIEIGLQPTHGAITPSPVTDQNTGNHAALGIDCMTGAVRIYRP